MTAEEIWVYDNEKKLLAENYGYDLLYVWESDYVKNPQEEINKCIMFLTND